MADKTENKNRSSFFQYGWWTIAIGVLFFATFLLDYNTKNILKYDGIDKLAAIIASTTGLCFSLAGLFFVLDNLVLQRKTLEVQQEELKHQVEEMKESNAHFQKQNDALLSQQYQVTFFNILSSHSTRIETLRFGGTNGINGLWAYYSTMAANITQFKTLLSNGKFTAQQTQSNPVYLLNSEKDSWHAYFENLCTLMDFVETKLKDMLYYELYYNNLSTVEKFFIGLYCDCYNNAFTQKIKACKFDFLKYYETQSIRYRLEPSYYFPLIEIVKNGDPKVYSEAALKETENAFLVTLKVRDNILKLPVDLTNVRLVLSQNKVVMGGNSFTDTYTISKRPGELAITETQTTFICNLSKEITDGLLECQEYLQTQITIEFALKYNNESKTVLFYSRAVISNQGSRENRLFTL